ncbi:hypothetical protein ACTMU2_29740 [Cupriavidus basilensis]
MGVITGCGSSINEAMRPGQRSTSSPRSSQKRTPSLDIPPDLTKLDGGPPLLRAARPSGTSTLSNYSQSTKTREASPTETSCPRRRACAWSATATSAGS